MSTNKKTVRRRVRWDRLITVTLILAALIISLSMAVIRKNTESKIAPAEPPTYNQHDDSAHPDFDVTPESRNSKLMYM